MKNQSEEIGALRSANKQSPWRTGQKRPKKQPEKAAVWGERCPWKRTPWKRTWQFILFYFLNREIAIKGRICRERSNNAMLKRTEKRKQWNHMARNCESPQTSPFEGTSLHWWNNSVERPWGILSMFTTCLQVQSPCHSLWHIWTMSQTAH